MPLQDIMVNAELIKMHEEEITEIEHCLKVISAYIKYHRGKTPEDLGWGDVGILAFLNKQLAPVAATATTQTLEFTSPDA